MSGAALRAVAPVEDVGIPIKAADVRLGKDVLELLSTAMYVDPMVVFREYVQNAADSIETAQRAGVLSPAERGEVQVTIDPLRRSVCLRDNGVAIPSERLLEIMVALGGSSKRGSGARGFRGVGRLAGLGHAQELVFRSRTEDHEAVAEVRWDCRVLKSALADRDFAGDVADLIARVVTMIRRRPRDDEPPRFFEVELVRIVRGRSDKLLSPEAVSDYLAQVAPVPFDDTFQFGKQIADRLRPLPGYLELDIRINGGPSLTRPHRNEVDLGGRSSRFEDVTFAEVPSQTGEGLAALAWFLHHGYEGALTVGTLVKGPRLRVGNLQVGDGTILEDIFPETRFNAWSVGEVHVLDSRIIPNGRRDQFEPNIHYLNLSNHLSPMAKDIARRCRTSSARRSKLRDFDLTAEDVRGRLAVLQQGGLDDSARGLALASVEAALLRMEKVAGSDLLEDTDRTELTARVESLRRDVTATVEAQSSGDPLDHLSTAERLFFERMFGLIYAHSLNRVAAKSLVDRVLEREVRRAPLNGGTSQS